MVANIKTAKSYSAPVAFAMGLVLAAFLLDAGNALGQENERAGRFDSGKMWTFEYAPSEYFTETYGFAADDAWFERARMAALRIPGCSASFVSSHGLLATNHHCVRGRVAQISQGDEALLDNGFYAPKLEDERPIPGYFADQLIAIADISDEVFAAMDEADGESARNAARATVLDAVRDRLLREHRVGSDSVWVQIVPLYNGGRYSAYTFRRFTDVRLVFAVQLKMGFFGGDPDNFTYPRYALDFAFLRVYDDGQPYQSQNFFGWSEEGVQEGDPVFVIGNPGPTNRLNTIAQLEFQHDVQLPARLNFLRTRLDVLAGFYEADPETGESLNVRNRMFGLSNSLKATIGRLDALNTPVILARRRDAEDRLRTAIVEDENLQTQFAPIFDEIAEIQQEKMNYAAPYGAFSSITSGTYSSATLRRAVVAVRMSNAGGDSVEIFRRVLARISDQPRDMEVRFLTERFKDFQRYFGSEHEITRAALVGMSPAAAAENLLDHSVLATSSQTNASVNSGGIDHNDPALQIAMAYLPLYNDYRSGFGNLTSLERQLAAELGRARFEVYGSGQAPDATFSPRITDGVVKRYSYNGTEAPPFTTFYGLYDRYNSHRGLFDWSLPEQWQSPPPGLDLGTPLNFVSTADTYGGNSGSPAVTPALELVGLNFDRNMEGLSRDYIYLPERGRNVMVDVRAVRAALDHVYEADRIVAEISGMFYSSEAEADAAGN
jgi:Peptidase S46